MLTVENLKKEIKIYRKNEKTLYDMLALYSFILEKDKMDITSLIEVSLVEKIVEDFEDSEVTIPYKAANIEELLNWTYDKYKSIYDKYKDIEGCQEVCDNFTLSHVANYTWMNVSALKERKEKFNLMEILVNFSPEWASEYLSSDIPIKTRLDMLADILKLTFSEYERTRRSALSALTAEGFGLLRIDDENLEDRKQELLDRFVLGYNHSYDLRAYFNDLCESEKYFTMACLQDKVFNFNSLEYRLKDDNKELDGIVISAIGRLLCTGAYCYYDFMSLRESDSYSNIPRFIKNNDDYVAIAILDYESLCSYIRNFDFEITEGKMEFLTKRINDDIGYYNYHELEEAVKKYKETYKELNKDIVEIILRKSKNKQQYRLYLQYIKKMIESINIDKTLNEIKQEQEELLLKREELTNLLKTMSETANNKLVRTIKFN